MWQQVSQILKHISSWFFFLVIPENRFVMFGTITALPPKLVNDVGQPHLDTSNKFANIILRRVLFTCIKCH